jgi:spermidine dehydrogenase
MTTKVTRRDFLDGMTIRHATGLLTPTELLEQIASSGINPETASTYYPPTLTGMRGSHKGSFEVAHVLTWPGKNRLLAIPSTSTMT